MKPLAAALLALTLLAAPTLVHAAPVTYYVNDGVFADGSTFSGSFTFDIQGNVNGTFKLSSESQTADSSTEINAGTTFEVFDFSNGDGFNLDLNLPGGPANPTNIPMLCTTADNYSGTCNDNPTYLFLSSSGPVSATAGTVSLTPPLTPTPEPSSLILLGTASLGLFGATRRRFFSRS